MSPGDALTALIGTPNEPAKLLVTGGIGTGKTTRVSAVRAALRGAGRPVLSTVPTEPEIGSAAIVIDDVQLLDDDALRRLTALVSRPELTVLVAAEPLAHRPPLSALFTAESAGLRYAIYDDAVANPFPSPIPEPSSWSMTITGFAAAGAMLRRARRSGPPLNLGPGGA